MTDRHLIENRLRHKELEIQHLEARLREAKGYARALRELLGLEPASDRSMVEEARDIIRDKGHSVHITELLRVMGKEVTRENRVSLTGALSAYVRRGDIFAKVGPNQFTLIELKHHKNPKISKGQPPDNFGELEPTTEVGLKQKSDTDA